MNRDSHESLSTADLANASETRARNATAEQMKREARTDEDRAEQRAAERTARGETKEGGQKLAALFPTNVGDEFRARWDQVQFSFVDDPKRAVREGDELVAQVMKCLAQSFSQERARLEQELNQNDAGSTENLRVALQRYRSFFHRLLSL